MCGIVVLTDSFGGDKKFQEMMQDLRHRGPDDSNWLGFKFHEGDNVRRCKNFYESNVLLGHQRLSILDLSYASRQPMSSRDDRLHLVYNGEIYNFKELREELIKSGFSFETLGDTEVVLVALQAWGRDAVKRFRGMFSFVLYDKDKNSITAARDPFGIKPLYYCKWSGGWALSSEPEPLLRLNGVSKEENPQAVYDYLLVGATEHSESTFYRDINQIPQATILEINLKNHCLPKLERYWKPDKFSRNDLSFDEATSLVRSSFFRSIELHMRSDVEVSAALSGGIDSSAIVCATRAIFPDAKLNTYSYISESKSLSEERWIEIVNKHVGASSHVVRATDEDLINELRGLLVAQGEPFGSTSIFAQYKVFQAASRDGVKVMLDGQGADEILAGYSIYQGSRAATLLKKGNLVGFFNFMFSASKLPGLSLGQISKQAVRDCVPKLIGKPLRSIFGKKMPPSWLHLHWTLKNSINVSPDFLYPRVGHESLKSRLIETVELSSLPHLLRYADRNSMHFSIESRVPFLDLDFASLVLSLPESYIISDEGVSKYVFRNAMRGIVPDCILDRRDKIGFATAENSWVNRRIEWFSKILKQEGADTCLITEIIVKHIKDVGAGKAPFDFRIWRWTNYLLWRCLKNNPKEFSY